MRSTNPHRLITSATHRFSRTSTSRLSAVPDEDRRQLLMYMQQPDVATLPFLGHVLRHKVAACEPAADSNYDGVVTVSSCVTYALDGGIAQTGLLNHRARTGSGSGVIPVCSLLGAALIGMRIGQRTPLLLEDGTIASLTVLDVRPSA